MATAPYGVRLLVGAAVTALDETRKLPQTILTYPMTVASQLAHLVMKVQQDVADLVNRGDEALEELFPPKDEQPEWATFDEDDPRDRFADASDADDSDDLASVTRLTGDKVANRSEGRFALFSEGEARAEAPEAATAPTSNGQVPAIVDKIGYETLTLAQLRARLTSLKLTDLEALLAFEEANKARAPFQTLIANRITRASAK
ncbi:lipid droplet-associated protein [Mycolicibacterium sp. 22603]|uniref:lipid droplet-associated protein n=1 Tax=Mycolicibacterium sp. 22603 TaxID=3453950 RepID=UPI003F85D949